MFHLLCSPLGSFQLYRVQRGSNEQSGSKIQYSSMAISQKGSLIIIPTPIVTGSGAFPLKRKSFQTKYFILMHFSLTRLTYGCEMSTNRYTWERRASFWYRLFLSVLMLQLAKTRHHHNELFVSHLYENRLEGTGAVLSEGEWEVSNWNETM